MNDVLFLCRLSIVSCFGCVLFVGCGACFCLVMVMLCVVQHRCMFFFFACFVLCLCVVLSALLFCVLLALYVVVCSLFCVSCLSPLCCYFLLVVYCFCLCCSLNGRVCGLCCDCVSQYVLIGCASVFCLCLVVLDVCPFVMRGPRMLFNVSGLFFLLCCCCVL